MTDEINDYAAVPPPARADLPGVVIVVGVLGSILGLVTAAICALVILIHWTWLS